MPLSVDDARVSFLRGAPFQLPTLLFFFYRSSLFLHTIRRHPQVISASSPLLEHIPFFSEKTDANHMVGMNLRHLQLTMLG